MMATATPAPRQLSSQGLALIKEVEGFRASSYIDSAGYETVGYGHKLTDAELSRHDYQLVNSATAEQLLRRDVLEAEAAVNDLVSRPLSQAQFDALVSFTYNVGRGALARSSLLRQLNSGNYSAVPNQLRRWTIAGGSHAKGLAARRKLEIARWLA
jgi:lysozyme